MVPYINNKYNSLHGYVSFNLEPNKIKDLLKSIGLLFTIVQDFIMAQPTVVGNYLTGLDGLPWQQSCFYLLDVRKCFNEIKLSIQYR